MLYVWPVTRPDTVKVTEVFGVLAGMALVPVGEKGLPVMPGIATLVTES